MRLRLQQCAEMLAAGLHEELRVSCAAPLQLITIGGGTAIDMLNSLILVKRVASEQLRRPIDIVTLDLDTAGATFGQRATAALCAAGAPLSGLEIQFRSEVYDWNDVRKLVEIVNAAIAREAIVAASSEGGLFEYGSDAAIIANLSALHAAGRGA